MTKNAGVRFLRLVGRESIPGLKSDSQRMIYRCCSLFSEQNEQNACLHFVEVEELAYYLYHALPLCALRSSPAGLCVLFLVSYDLIHHNPRWFAAIIFKIYV